jgi:hypothetical protein
VIGVEIGLNDNILETTILPERDCDRDNVKDPLIVILLPDIGSRVFTLNVLIFLLFIFYNITNLAPGWIVIEPELNMGPINNALYDDETVNDKD